VGRETAEMTLPSVNKGITSMKIKRLIGTIALFLATAFSVHAQVPQIINYQGRVLVGSINYDGSGQFKFALVNANGTISIGVMTALAPPVVSPPMRYRSR